MVCFGGAASAVLRARDEVLAPRRQRLDPAVARPRAAVLRGPQRRDAGRQGGAVVRVADAASAHAADAAAAAWSRDAGRRAAAEDPGHAQAAQPEQKNQNAKR